MSMLNKGLIARTTKKKFFVYFGIFVFLIFLNYSSALEIRPNSIDRIAYSTNGVTPTADYTNLDLINDSNFNTYISPIFVPPVPPNRVVPNYFFRGLNFTFPINSSLITLVLNYNVSVNGTNPSGDTFSTQTCAYNYSSGTYFIASSGASTNAGNVNGRYNMSFSLGRANRIINNGRASITLGQGATCNFPINSIFDGRNVSYGFSEILINYTLDNLSPGINVTNLNNGQTINSTTPSRSYVFRINNTDNLYLDNCWYSLDGASNTSYSCTNGAIATATISNISTGVHTIRFYAQDDAGGIASETRSFNFYMYGLSENAQTYNALALERSLENFRLNITYDTTYYTSANAYLIYNSTQYSTTYTTNGDNVSFTTNVILPEVNTDQNISFYWQITLSNSTSSVNFNSTFKNQTVLNLSIDDCSTFGTLIYNFTLKDENTRSILNGSLVNSSIEVDLKLSSLGTRNEFITYHHTYDGINPATICLSDPLNQTTYRVDLIASYVADSYVQEFYYIDNGTLQNSTLPNNIDFYDLPLADSTTFLFTFLDENGLETPGVIIETLRYYIGAGKNDVEVERSKEDDNGETHIHLVEEDVIYKFRVTLNNREIYLSDQYNAKCLSTPCAITLSAQPDTDPFPTVYNNLPLGSYSIIVNKDTREVTLMFNLNQTALMNLTIITANNNNAQVVATGTALASQGSVVVTVPLSYGNVTYYAVIYQGSVFVATRVIDLTDSPQQYFGATGLFMAALAILCLGLMGASHGEWVILWALLGVIAMSVMFIIDVPFYALGTLVAAALLLLYKLTSRRRL